MTLNDKRRDTLMRHRRRTRPVEIPTPLFEAAREIAERHGKTLPRYISEVVAWDVSALSGGRHTPRSLLENPIPYKKRGPAPHHTTEQKEA